MSKASGVVLILAGLATAAYVLPSGEMTDPDFGQITDVAKTQPAEDARRVAIVAEPKPAERPARREAVPSFSAPVVVTIAQRPSERPAPVVQQKAASIPRDREAIGRELQKELRRVGCYDGELNGAWTASTRQAMKAFTDRVNASLPTDEPDTILLTMVRGYQDRVCGKPCPAGQGLGGDGRCVPNAILVRATPRPSAPVAIAAPIPAKKPTPAITGWSTTATAAAPTPPIGFAPSEGRMALAGPQADPAAVPGTARGCAATRAGEAYAAGHAALQERQQLGSRILKEQRLELMCGQLRPRYSTISPRTKACAAVVSGAARKAVRGARSRMRP